MKGCGYPNSFRQIFKLGSNRQGIIGLAAFRRENGFLPAAGSFPQLRVERRQGFLRERNGSGCPPRFRGGRPRTILAHLLGNVQFPAEEIHVLDSQPPDFAAAQPRGGRHDNHAGQLRVRRHPPAGRVGRLNQGLDFLGIWDIVALYLL